MSFIDTFTGIVNAGSNLLGGIGYMTNSERNFQQQQLEFQYQHAMNKIGMAREDNAIQRRVADLKAAGLSPVLAAGKGATATIPQAPKAPQRDPNQYMGFKDVMAQIMALQKMQKDIGRTAAETKLIEQNAERVKIANEHSRNVNPYKVTQQAVKAYIADVSRNWQARTPRAKYNLLLHKESLTLMQINKILQDTSLQELRVVEQELKNQGIVFQNNEKEWRALLAKVIYESKKRSEEWYRKNQVPFGTTPNIGNLPGYMSGQAMEMDRRLGTE